MSNHKYKFTIISAVYNVEPFIKETIDSIIEQTLGLKHVQLILVDDGSPDNSGKICDEYAEKYPDNIFVIHKENGGVSSARNAGLEHIQGKYVNFIDSDDKWEPNTLSAVWDFFEAHHDEIDIVATPLVYFDAKEGDHILNYKFDKGSRVVDLNEEWEIIQMSATSCFFKSEIFKDIKFDTNLCYAEDAKVVQTVLLNKQALGLLADVHYLYRARSEGAASAMQSTVERANWYLPVLQNFHLNIVKKAIDRYGIVPKFTQMVLMYDLQWRIKLSHVNDKAGLNSEEQSLYLKHIKEVLQYIEEDVISVQKNLMGEHKVFALSLKHSAQPKFVETEKDILCAFSEEARFSLANSRVKIEFLQIEDNVVKIEGSVAIYNLPFDNLDIFLFVNNQRIKTQVITRESSVYCLGNEVLKWHGFSAEFTLDPNVKFNKFCLGANINGKLIFFQKYFYGYFSPITCDYRFAHYNKDNWMAVGTKKSVNIVAASFKNRFLRELKFLLWLFKNNRNQSRSQLFLRLWYRIRSRFNKKPIWLVSDRPKVAGDNGEAFFRYMRTEHPEVDTRLVISKGCPDYERMKKIGPVVDMGSRKHKMLVLLSEYIVSSQGENEHFDPFGKSRNVFRDIMANKPFVFLQHGVIKDDLSDWLNRYNKNIFGFITSAKAEQDSIIEYNYSYTEKEVWLTGLPRFDRLYNNEQKIITVMPTWRKYLTNGSDPKTGAWRLISNFDESEFFIFYNSLFNNQLLLSKMKEHGYKIRFLLHPNLRSAAGLFDSNDLVEVVSDNISYTDMYAVSNLIITDYSSAIFDFVYLRKPIIYTHFDFEKFVSGAHSYVEGYFDYKRDGFGEVEYDLGATVDRIIEYMENGCKLKDFYRQRIDNFFAFNDKNNSQRVYEKLIAARKNKA